MGERKFGRRERQIIEGLRGRQRGLGDKIVGRKYREGGRRSIEREIGVDVKNWKERGKEERIINMEMKG